MQLVLTARNMKTRMTLETAGLLICDQKGSSDEHAHADGDLLWLAVPAVVVEEDRWI